MNEWTNEWKLINKKIDERQNEWKMKKMNEWMNEWK